MNIKIYLILNENFLINIKESSLWKKKSNKLVAQKKEKEKLYNSSFLFNLATLNTGEIQ